MLAAKCFELAAEFVDLLALAKYGLCLLQGPGLEKNGRAAVDLLNIAASGGSTDALSAGFIFTRFIAVCMVI